MQNYKIIKFVTRGSTKQAISLYIYLSPHNENIWKNCKFVYDPTIEEYDWYVAFDNIPNMLPGGVEHLKCPKENTILVTSEPSSIARYGKGYAGQFKYLITNHNEKVLPHPNAKRSQTGIYWLYGKHFDDIVKDNFLPKTKKISTICSDKKEGHTMHRKRYDFTLLMQQEIPELDRYGRGFEFVKKKYEAIDDYEFHVVIENHIEKHMWSEKLADAFLGFCVPIYCGCPNVYDYFPKDSLITIDIDDPKGSIEKIKKIISTPGEYERRFEAVKEARRRVIYEYNLLNMICEIVNSSKEYDFTPNAKIYSKRMMRARHIDDLLKYFGFRIGNFIKGFLR